MMHNGHVGLVCVAALALVVLGAACGAKQAAPPPMDTAGRAASSQAELVIGRAK